MKRIRVEKSKNFTTINNEFIFNKNLSLKAKGLLCHLLALPNDWKLYVEEVEKWSTDGKSAIYSAFKELTSNGYMKREQIREKGKIVSWDYIVFEKDGKRWTRKVAEPEPIQEESFQEEPEQEQEEDTRPTPDGGTRTHRRASKRFEPGDRVRFIRNVYGGACIGDYGIVLEAPEKKKLTIELDQATTCKAGKRDIVLDNE